MADKNLNIFDLIVAAMIGCMLGILIGVFASNLRIASVRTEIDRCYLDHDQISSMKLHSCEDDKHDLIDYISQKCVQPRRHD